MPTSVHSLDEVMHLAIVKLRELPNRAAIVRRRGRPPVRIRTPEVKPALASADRTLLFQDRTRAQSPYLSAAADADAEIAGRNAALTGGMEDALTEADFWTEAS